MTELLNFWLVVRSLLPVLLAVAALVLIALILDAAWSNDGKW